MKTATRGLPLIQRWAMMGYKVDKELMMSERVVVRVTPRQIALWEAQNIHLGIDPTKPNYAKDGGGYTTDINEALITTRNSKKWSRYIGRNFEFVPVSINIIGE